MSFGRKINFCNRGQHKYAVKCWKLRPGARDKIGTLLFLGSSLYVPVYVSHPATDKRPPTPLGKQITFVRWFYHRWFFLNSKILKDRRDDNFLGMLSSTISTQELKIGIATVQPFLVELLLLKICI